MLFSPDPITLFLAGVFLGVAVFVLARIARAFPAGKQPRKDLLTHDDERLSETRQRELETSRDEARAEMDRTVPPPGALGG